MGDPDGRGRDPGIYPSEMVGSDPTAAKKHPTKIRSGLMAKPCESAEGVANESTEVVVGDTCGNIGGQLNRALAGAQFGMARSKCVPPLVPAVDRDELLPHPDKQPPVFHL